MQPRGTLKEAANISLAVEMLANTGIFSAAALR
jgi:hypothetical protein